MIFLNITLNTQMVSSGDVKILIQGGQTLHSVGTLNARWEEFSALEAAQNAGISDVIWDTVYDDTAGSLELTIWYPQLDQDSIKQRFTEIDGIEAYEVESVL